MITWSVFGGFLLHAFLANFRGMLLTPVYEKAIDTAQDIFDKGMIPVESPGSYILLDHLRDSPTPMYHQLAARSVKYDDWDAFYKVAEEGIFGAGTQGISTRPLFIWFLSI